MFLVIVKHVNNRSLPPASVPLGYVDLSHEFLFLRPFRSVTSRYFAAFFLKFRRYRRHRRWS